MNFPKSLIIGGVKWKVNVSKIKISGGNFEWYTHTINVEKGYSDDRKFQVLIHEICEIIMVNNIMRYQKCFYGQPHNGDYLFSFSHDRFEIYTDELAGILKQFVR